MKTVVPYQGGSHSGPVVGAAGGQSLGHSWTRAPTIEVSPTAIVGGEDLYSQNSFGTPCVTLPRFTHERHKAMTGRTLVGNRLGYHRYSQNSGLKFISLLSSDSCSLAEAGQARCNVRPQFLYFYQVWFPFPKPSHGPRWQLEPRHAIIQARRRERYASLLLG